jgi:Tol biopolymer transport system component
MRPRILVLALVVSAFATASSGSPAPGSSPSPGPLVQPGEPWIVYNGGTDGPARIRLVRPDGTDDHTLVPDLIPEDPLGWQQHPDWSHDGTRIAFGAEQDDGTQDIWVANADGTGVVELYDCASPCGWADHPAWSPDDRTIAIMTATRVGDVDSTSALELIDVLTGSRRTVLSAPDLAWFYVPRWSPEGDRIVVEATRFATARFDEERAMAGTVGIIDLKQDVPTFDSLLPWESFAAYPDWSPGGTRIVFSLPAPADDHDGPADLSILDLGTGTTMQLTHFAEGGGWAIQPSWTPDGSQVIFVGEDVVRTHPNVALIGGDGHGLTRLADSFFRTHPRMRPTR